MDEDFDLSLLDLPLPDFLRGYAEFLDEDPDLWGEESGALFQLVRGVKAHQATRGLQPDEAYAKVVDAAKRHGISELLELGLDDEDGEVAFHSMWARVRFPLGTDPIEAACRSAGKGELKCRAPGQDRATATRSVTSCVA